MRIRIAPEVSEALSGGTRTPSDAEYVQFVRRFRRSELVSLIARVAPQYAFNELKPEAQTLITPWGLADVARVSLAFGNDHARQTPTMHDLHKCLLMHNNLGHERLEDQHPDALPSVFLQLAFYQLPFQQHVGSLLGRTIALLDHTTADEPSRLKRIVGDWQTGLLGCSLTAFAGVTQLLMAAAAPNGGHFDPAWLERHGPSEINELFDPQITREVLRNHLAANINTYRSLDRQQPSIGRRFTFNPLIDRPIVDGIGSSLTMPAPDFVLWKASPSGVYFTGLKRWGEEFAHDLGYVFQAYVGRHLKLMRVAEVHAEITYGTRKQRKDSVDWIVVFPSLVLLVEVKTARPTEAVRMGSDEAAAAFQRAFNKGNDQIDATVGQIAGNAPEFAHIPSDRPFMGIVVTLEDFLVANSMLHRPMYTSSTTVPTFAVSIAELEQLVCMGPGTESFLHQVRTGGPNINLQGDLAKASFENAQNPILRAGIDATPVMGIKGAPN